MGLPDPETSKATDPSGTGSATTNSDLRDLLWRIGNSPGEIEAHMANPYTRAYLRVFIDEFNRRAAELIAQRIAEKLFPEHVQTNVE